jgi:hypothetical protein
MNPNASRRAAFAPSALAALLAWISGISCCIAQGGIEGPERAPVLAPLAAPRSANEQCLLDTLTELGWRIGQGSGDALAIDAGLPCMRSGLDDARAHGDLRLQLPLTQQDAAAREVALEALLEHPASHCAWSMRIGDATRRAVNRLVANTGFRFSALQTGWIGFGLGGAGRDGWERTRSFGRGYRPRDTPSRAIEGFYAADVRAECGVGRQIAQYATLYELFGPKDFDAAFARDEIMIGTFHMLEHGPSVLLGSSAGEFRGDGRGRRAASEGRQAFSGLPGFIVHVFARDTLDDINNQAENFVIYEVSDAAARALAAMGGLDATNVRARELWELSRGLDLTADRVFERLLYQRDASLLAAISPGKHETLRRMQALLDDPVFQGVQVYVHPKGVKPIAYHFARLIDRNPRTPFRIEIGLHNLHTTIYRRWIDQRRQRCTEAASAQTSLPFSPREKVARSAG